jgi:signal peptidase II
MNAPAGLVARGGYFLVSLAVVAADQVTKLAAHRFLGDGSGPVTIVPGFFDLWYSRNAGGLFGSFRDWAGPARFVLLTLLPIAAVLLIARFLVRGRATDRPTLLGLSLILGGAVGNLIDRLIRGEVIDFLDVYVAPSRLATWLEGQFGTAHWPTGNLADSAIVVGACLLLFTIVRPQAGAEAGEARPPDGSGADADRSL